MTGEDIGRAVFDTLSVGVVLGTLASWLPPFAAFLTILWTAIRIYETKTVQGVIKRRRRVEQSLD